MQTACNPAGKIRFYSIDILRFIAITGMVITHFVGFMSDNAMHPYQILIKKYVYYFGSLLSVPLFLYCSGFSMAYASIKKTNVWSRAQIIKRNIKKGLVLFGFGILYTIFIHGIDKITYFWILQCIGLFLVVFSPLFDKVVISLLMIFISFFIILVLHFYPQIYHIQVTSIHNFRVAEYIVTLLLSGNFAIIPWSVFFLSGIIIGNSCARQEFSIVKVLIASCLLIVLSIILSRIGNLVIFMEPFSMIVTKYPVSPNYMLLFSGITLLLAAIFYWLFDFKKIVFSNFVMVQRVSSLSLTIFCFHYAWGLVFLLKGVAKVTSEPVVAILIAFLFISVFGSISKWWQKFEYRYSLEYFMKLTDHRKVKGKGSA